MGNWSPKLVYVEMPRANSSELRESRVSSEL